MPARHATTRLVLVLSSLSLGACGGASESSLFGAGPPCTGSACATAGDAGTGGGAGGGAGGAAAGGTGGATVGSGGATAGSGGATAGSGGATLATGGAPDGGQPQPTPGDASAEGAASRACHAGEYRGTFAGTFNVPSGAIQPSGTIALNVQQSGAITGLFGAETPLKIQATITGQVDCASGAVTATIERAPYQILFPPVYGTITGTITGQLTSGGGFDGGWSVVESNAGITGTGSWTAS